MQDDSKTKLKRYDNQNQFKHIKVNNQILNNLEQYETISEIPAWCWSEESKIINMRSLGLRSLK